MLTQRLITRFWQTMAERYGKRWTDDYGTEPLQAWKDLLDDYHPKAIRDAIRLLASESPLHPPTEPQFENLLKKAEKALRGDPRDYRRDFWRGAMVMLLERELCDLRRLMARPEVERYIATHRKDYEPLRATLDELCAKESDMGQRTPGLSELLRQRVAERVASVEGPLR